MSALACARRWAAIKQRGPATHRSPTPLHLTVRDTMRAVRFGRRAHPCMHSKALSEHASLHAHQGARTSPAKRLLCSSRHRLQLQTDPLTARYTIQRSCCCTSWPRPGAVSSIPTQPRSSHLAQGPAGPLGLAGGHHAAATRPGRPDHAGLLGGRRRAARVPAGGARRARQPGSAFVPGKPWTGRMTRRSSGPAPKQSVDM